MLKMTGEKTINPKTIPASTRKTILVTYESCMLVKLLIRRLISASAENQSMAEESAYIIKRKTFSG